MESVAYMNLFASALSFNVPIHHLLSCQIVGGILMCVVLHPLPQDRGGKLLTRSCHRSQRPRQRIAPLYAIAAWVVGSG